MFALLLTLLAAFLLISPIQAVCPGYNYAFWSFPSREMNRVRWAVSDSWCIFRSNCALGNPCDCPYQGCSPPPVHVDKVTILGLWYVCRPDVNPGYCSDFLQWGDGDVPESCCRNDGRRNFELGLVNAREYLAINETNALLDIQKREYDNATARGMSSEDIMAMRHVHARDLKVSEMKQIEARST